MTHSSRWRSTLEQLSRWIDGTDRRPAVKGKRMQRRHGNRYLLEYLIRHRRTFCSLQDFAVIFLELMSSRRSGDGAATLQMDATVVVACYEID